MTSQNNRAHLLHYAKLCASFHTHWWIQSGVTVQKFSIWVKIGDFLSCVTLKFDGWPWKTIGHILYATSSFLNNFKAICEFKPEWQSANPQFSSKSAIFVPCDLEIWWMTSKNNWAPLLCYSKIWASFHSHLWIQTGVTVQKIPIWDQINNFFHPVILKFDGWPWKIIGHIFYATSNFMKHFVAICEFKLGIQSGNDQFGSKSTIFFCRVTLKFDRWPLKSIGHLS